MKTTLRILLGVLGAAAVTIALSILLRGAGPTAALAEGLFDAVSGWTGPSTPTWPPAMDNELRFYAALWLSFGVLCLRATRSLDAHARSVPSLAAVFFVGGVGRALSLAGVGMPHPVFVALMVMELALPPVMVLVWAAYRKRVAPRSAAAAG